MAKRIRKTRPKPSNKAIRTIEEIGVNLKLRRYIYEFVEHINRRERIPVELLEAIEKTRCSNISHFIPQKAPNISNEATESLVCILLRKKLICKDRLKNINSIERRGNRKGDEGGADILVNGNVKIEVKGTTVKNDITTKSKSNADVFALVWVETEDWMKRKSKEIVVKVLYNPHGIEVEHLVSNGENKIRLCEAFKKLKESGLAEEYLIDIDNLGIVSRGQFFDNDVYLTDSIEVKPLIEAVAP
jgi:hypothetical protein